MEADAATTAQAVTVCLLLVSVLANTWTRPIGAVTRACSNSHGMTLRWLAAVDPGEVGSRPVAYCSALKVALLMHLLLGLLLPIQPYVSS